MNHIPKPLLLFAVLVSATSHLFGQTCIYKDLSEKMNITVHTRKIKIQDVQVSSILTISIKDKRGKPIQTIKFATLFLNSDVSANCRLVRSYTTGKNKKAEVSDYDFGNLIVADLNFDGKEDLAVKCDDGGNGGPLYNFYIQQPNGQFAIDPYLTDSVGSFPIYINKQKRTLTTIIHANARYEAKTVYRIDPQKGRWVMISRTFVP
jgi:hypothetical protein